MTSPSVTADFSSLLAFCEAEGQKKRWFKVGWDHSSRKYPLLARRAGIFPRAMTSPLAKFLERAPIKCRPRCPGGFRRNFLSLEALIDFFQSWVDPFAFKLRWR